MHHTVPVPPYYSRIMTLPRFIYFDLDDTLLDHGTAERLALADVCRNNPSLFDAFDERDVEDIYHRHNTDLWTQYAAGALSKEELKRLRFERLLEALTVEGADASDLGDEYLRCYANHWRYIDGAEAAFHALADEFAVGILTNGFSEIQSAKLEQFPELKRRAGAVVVSEEIGFMKPHPRIFAYATEMAGEQPEHILYVGDSFVSDVQGARGAGWRVAWFRGNDGVTDGDPAVYRFDDWDELVSLLIR